MGRPVTNGLVEFVDSKSEDHSFFCMKLAAFIMKEGVDLWELRFSQAKSGQCFYRDQCPKYTQTMEKKKGVPIQLSLNF